jgi:hypothetical protein
LAESFNISTPSKDVLAFTAPQRRRQPQRRTEW